mmetsp:Transcript_4522/g.3698  ORF Transcript_4522/g.3698 Transcript_4522/m.3698 type:complete len:87 (+) Transcript_4522:329-589(+)
MYITAIRLIVVDTMIEPDDKVLISSLLQLLTVAIWLKNIECLQHLPSTLVFTRRPNLAFVLKMLLVGESIRLYYYPEQMPSLKLAI